MNIARKPANLQKKYLHLFMYFVRENRNTFYLRLILDESD